MCRKVDCKTCKKPTFAGIKYKIYIINKIDNLVKIVKIPNSNLYNLLPMINNYHISLL